MDHRIYSIRQKQIIINFVKSTEPDVEQLRDFISARCGIDWNMKDRITYYHLVSILRGEYWNQ